MRCTAPNGWSAGKASGRKRFTHRMSEKTALPVAEFARIRVCLSSEDPNSGEFGYGQRVSFHLPLALCELKAKSIVFWNVTDLPTEWINRRLAWDRPINCPRSLFPVQIGKRSARWK